MSVTTHMQDSGAVFRQDYSPMLVAPKDATLLDESRVFVPSRDLGPPQSGEGADAPSTRRNFRSHLLSLCVNWASSRLLKKAGGTANDRPGGLSHNTLSRVCRSSGTGFQACLGLFQHPASLAGAKINLRMIAAIVLSVLALGAIADRVAVVVGNDVITESEVLDEVRLTEFQNGKLLDLGPTERRAAAERLVDQQLIRHEMEIAQFPQPAPSEAEALVSAFRQRFPTDEAFRAALERHEITELQLAQHLLWQLAVIRFTDLRFRSLAPSSGNVGPSSPAEAEASPVPALQGSGEPSPGRQFSGSSTPSLGATSGGNEARVDRQMESWLKEQRSQTRIQFKKEAFE